MQLRLRPPGVDLWTTHAPSAAEVALQFLLLGAVFLHELPVALARLPPGALGGVLGGALAGADDACASSVAAALAADRPAHIALSLVVLAAPGALAWAADAAGRAVRRAAVAAAGPASAGAAPTNAAASGSGPAPFASLAYGYLPLVWAATLAYYEAPLMTEGGALLRTAARMAGADAAAAAALPAVVAGPDAVAFAQGATLLLGAGASLALTRKLGKCGWGEGLGAQALMIGGFTAALWGMVFPCYQ